MFSLKSATRRTMTVLLAAAMTTTVFVGCSQQENLDVETTETVELIDELVPGIEEVEDTNDFSIKYKYWYDNPEVAAAQSSSTAADDSVVDTFPGVDNINVYEDSEGQQYLISGRTKVYLTNGQIMGSEALLLRDSNGDKIYFTSQNIDTINEKLTEFDEYLSENGLTANVSYEDRQTRDLAEAMVKEVSEDLPLYVNNLQTDSFVQNGMIPVGDLFLGFNNLGYVEVNDDTIEVTMYTAAGFVVVTFKSDGSKVDVSYSTGIEGTTLAVLDDVLLTESTVWLTPKALERVLGYDVEIYDEFVNVVTDNHDIFSSDRVISVDAVMAGIDDSRSVDISSLDPDNPIPDSDSVYVDNAVIDSTSETPATTPETAPSPTTTADTTTPTPTTTTSAPTEDDAPIDDTSGRTSNSLASGLVTSTGTTLPEGTSLAEFIASLEGKEYASKDDLDFEPVAAWESTVTTPNTVNDENTPGHENALADNEARTHITVKGVDYWVDDNGVLYDRYAAPVNPYNIGWTIEDTTAAARAADEHLANGGKIGDDVTPEEALDFFGF